MKHLLPKPLIICGYGVCILYTGALLMLESRLNYPLMNDDAGFYIQLTQSSAEQGLANALRQLPDWKQVPPLLNLGMLFLTGHTALTAEQAGYWLCIVAVMLAACGVFFLCRQLYSRLDLAFAAALLSLSLPGWYRHAGGILRDPLFWMETVWFFGLLLKYKQENCSDKKLLGYVLFLAVLGGMMLLTRKEAPIFLLPGILWFALPAAEFKLKWRQGLGAGMLLFLLALLISLLPNLAGIDFLPWCFWDLLQMELLR